MMCVDQVGLSLACRPLLSCVKKTDAWGVDQMGDVLRVWYSGRHD